VLAAVAAALVGSSNPTPAAPVPKHLMPKEEPFCYPTHVGDRHESVINDCTIVCVVTKVEKTPDGLLVQTEDEAGDGTRSHCQTVILSASGIKVIEYSGKKLETPFWWVKLPHGENNTWTDVWSSQTRNWKTVGWEPVTVPAGTFRAIRVERDDGPGVRTTTYWFAPGMGCIKWSSDGSGREMTAFKPGK
jgi:hypothetical protein